ncbi:GrpB family protein [Bacillus sp. JCM 19041]|uniref:GrpB family protein n=1 Tax=Bacillus sp. JCM 19041 TaxID=1460637 RepID=UPI0006CF682B
MRLVEVVDYQPSWQDVYKQEAIKLEQVFQENMIGIHHIGSTSVPGLAAKPIIDLLIVLKRIEDADKQTEAMEKLGYEVRGENGIAGRRYFQKGGDARTHHVHIFSEGHTAIKEHLVFRDYLQQHPDAMQAYGQLKKKLAQAYVTDVAAYINGKDDWINVTKRRAMEWAFAEEISYE